MPKIQPELLQGFWSIERLKQLEHAFLQPLTSRSRSKIRLSIWSIFENPSVYKPVFSNHSLHIFLHRGLSKDRLTKTTADIIL